MLLSWGLKTIIRIAILFMSLPGKSGFKCRKRSRNAENGKQKLEIRLPYFYHGFARKLKN